MVGSFLFQFPLITTLCILLLWSAPSARAQVPANQTFRFVNEGEFGEYVTEYDASYRIISTDVDDFYTFPFTPCFYNTTPGAYVFAIRAGTRREEDLMRWVWDANRNNPVGDNSTLTFGRDGNLVVAEANGKVVWQTNTANKGVRGIKLLPNGNLVLYDRRGRFVWQSFDHPSDTLLVGMSLKKNGKPNKLVSRTSEADGRDGKYSLVFDNSGLNMYLDNDGQRLKYGGWTGNEGNIVTFNATSLNDENTAYEIVLDFSSDTPPPPSKRRLLQSRPIGSVGQQILSKRNYNATISFLRIESDGGLRAYTYYPLVSYLRWEESFSYFSPGYIRECALPTKCGSYGLCQRRMCVACPTPKGLLGWSESCAPPKTPPCGATKVNYYKITGVEHFLNPILDDGEGPLKVEQCRDKCTKDCKCKGFIYKQDTSKCLLAPLLGTLIRDVNTSIGYIKY